MHIQWLCDEWMCVMNKWMLSILWFRWSLTPPVCLPLIYSPTHTHTFVCPFIHSSIHSFHSPLACIQSMSWLVCQGCVLGLNRGFNAPVTCSLILEQLHLSGLSIECGLVLASRNASCLRWNDLPNTSSHVLRPRREAQHLLKHKMATPCRAHESLELCISDALSVAVLLCSCACPKSSSRLTLYLAPLGLVLMVPASSIQPGPGLISK